MLADARPGGALPPLDRAAIDAIESRERRGATRVGVGAPAPAAAAGDGGAWRFWLPLALVPVGGLVGFGAATLLGLRACSRMAIALGGGLALGATGAATISLMNKKGGSA